MPLGWGVHLGAATAAATSPADAQVFTDVPELADLSLQFGHLLDQNVIG